MSRPRFLQMWRTQPARFFAVAFALALVLAGAERFAGRLRSHLLQPLRGACWIWAAGDHGQGKPIAFYALREIEVDEVESGTIAIAADETYLLYVNGRRIGSGSYRTGAPIDEYEISAWLEPGINRILVELRSSRGAGGMIAEIGVSLGDGVSPQRIVTDGDWRIFRRYDPGLFGGWSPLAGGETPEIWQRSPTGRWRLGSTRVARSIPREGFLSPVRHRPVRFQQQLTDLWRELSWPQRRIPALGPQQVFDWGEEVEGFLSFDLTFDRGEPGLLYFGSEPPDPNKRPPDEILLPVPGRRHWEAAYPRRFRYLLLVGAEPYSRIEVEHFVAGPADQAILARSHRGVFGIEPPRSYSKVEEDVWGSLERRVKDKQERRRAGQAAKKASRG